MEITLAHFDRVSIRLAVLCAKPRSLSAASREFPCSLSTGNLRLNTLEATLDRAPFTRDRRGLQAAAGKIFKRHAGPIMRGLEGTSLQVAMAPKDVPLVLDFPNEQGNGRVSDFRIPNSGTLWPTLWWQRLAAASQCEAWTTHFKNSSTRMRSAT